MAQQLIQHLQQYVPLEDQDAAELLRFFRPIRVPKKEILLSENQPCRYHFFVAKGCLRMFFINDKGTEQTIHFAIENWWITDYAAFEHQGASSFSIQAVEPSEVLAIDYPSQEQLGYRFPPTERYFRLILQRAYAAAQLRIKYLYDLSSEELYDHFRERFPGFVQRIPQYLLAQYLNMTPEYLSEIRRKKRS
jgi:CRP-like cAMP-binding protein